MTRAFLILLLSLTRCHAPATFAGTASFKGTAQFNQAVFVRDPVFNSITHYWALEEPSGTPRVDSVGGKTLTETVATPNAVGIHGNAADFRSLPTGLMSSSGFTITMPLSVAFWFKPSATDGRTFYSKDDSADGQISIQTTGSFISGGFQGGCDNFGGQAISGYVGNWHLLVMTFSADGNNCNMYLDGVLDPDGALHLGVGSNPAFNGLIDELMIFNTDIGQSGATALMTHFYSP